MTEWLTLGSLPVGACMCITALGGEAEMKQRLEDLGFSEGAEVCCLGAAPLGDPRAYEIRGAVIALRRRDAEQIIGRGTHDGA